MTNYQSPTFDGEEIITQSKAIAMCGVTRSTFRGFIDRKELRVADHLGSRDSARVYRSDVVKLITERKLPGGKGIGVPDRPEDERCPACLGRIAVEGRQRAEAQEAQDTIRRLRKALAAATE